MLKKKVENFVRNPKFHKTRGIFGLNEQLHTKCVKWQRYEISYELRNYRKLRTCSLNGSQQQKTKCIKCLKTSLQRLPNTGYWWHRVRIIRAPPSTNPSCLFKYTVGIKELNDFLIRVGEIIRVAIVLLPCGIDESQHTQSV